MDRTLLGHGALAALALGAAYVAWSQPLLAERDSTVVMVEGSPAALTEVDYQEEGTEVALHREGDTIAVTVTKLQPPTPPQTFPGTEQARTLLQNLAPLRAGRKLAALTDAQLHEFGLSKAQSTLTLHFGDRTQTVEIGKTTFGSGDYYARGPDGDVYLLRAATLSALGHGALALQDRDVVGLGRAKFDRVLVVAKDKRREFSQRLGDEPGRAFLADPGDPNQKLEMATTWVDRVLHLRVTDQTPDAPTEPPSLQVTFFKDRQEVNALRLWPGNDKGALGTSSRFKQPVVIYKGSVDGVLHDLDGIFNEGK